MSVHYFRIQKRNVIYMELNSNNWWSPFRNCGYHLWMTTKHQTANRCTYKVNTSDKCTPFAAMLHVWSVRDNKTKQLINAILPKSLPFTDKNIWSWDHCRERLICCEIIRNDDWSIKLKGIKYVEIWEQ